MSLLPHSLSGAKAAVYSILIIAIGAFLPTPAAGLTPGTILVTDTISLPNQPDIGSIFTIDPVSGDREVFSNFVVGNGPALAVPFGIAFDADGNVLVIDAGEDFAGDPLTSPPN